MNAPVESAEVVPMDEHQLAAMEREREQAEQARLDRLDDLARSLNAKRKSAIEARANSGIEQIWLEDEDAYDGIDDLNRWQEGAHGTRHRYTKSKSSSGTYSSTDNNLPANTCTLLPNITAPYVDAGAAAIADMLLPLDEWPFAIETTPIPELSDIVEKLKSLEDERPVQVPGLPGPMPAGKLKENAEKEIDRAKNCAKKAETRIKDWLTECQWHGKSRRQIDDSARVGTGVSKGPIPMEKQQYKWTEIDGINQLEVRKETKPVTETVDYWNLYPDYPACGENIHNGSHIFERGEITKKTLSDLRGQEGYFDTQIELCLEEGPQKFEVDATDRKQPIISGGPYEIWWFHGSLDREDAEAAGCDCSGKDEKYISIPAVITMVNGHVIRGALNHMDKGSFPYDILTWKRRPGMPWGHGIARQVRPAQQGITGCFRALMENAGLSAKPMLAVLRKYLEPTDGTWDLFGGKVFEVMPDADVREVKAAITTLTIDSRQSELLNIIQFNKQLAEDITGQPLLLQGQMGKAPDTVGGMTILNNNASVTKRRIARQFDDQVIEPSITRYYDYLMQYGEDEEEKGLYVIDARSSSVLVERDIQNKNMIQLLSASANPAYGADPRLAYAETCRAMKIDPKRLQYSDEKWEQIQKNAQQQPPDSRVAVEQIRAEVAQLRMQFEGQENEKDRRLKIAIETIDEQMQSAELTSLQRQVFDKLRVQLAGKAMEIEAQKQLTRDSQLLDLKKHNDVIRRPAVEPMGRAPKGQAFAR